MGRTQRAISALLALTLAMAATPVGASPIADKRAEAARVQQKLETIENRAEAATEDWNVARIEYEQVHAKVVKLERELARIKKRTTTLQTSLNTRVDSMYRSGPTGLLDVLLGSASFADFAATWDFLNKQNEQEASTVAELKTARAELAVTQAEFDKQQDKARGVYKTMSDRRNAILKDEAEVRSILRRDRKQLASLLAAQRAARRADSRAHGGSGGGTGWDWGDPPHAPRSGVVSIALKYLGRPYRWAASGPYAFDCSGFTMFVYAQVGVRLPHSSRAQIGYGHRVSRANMMPGDLVFFGSPIHHVGIYIGNGKMVHAPHTGDVVSIDPCFRSDFAGACRP